jgi:Ion channel
MGDALWWTLQTATTSTFGPNVSSTEGRILGSVIMIVGIGITGAFISTLASGLTRSRASSTSEKDPVTILKFRLAKGEITKEAYLELLNLLSEWFNQIILKYHSTTRRRGWGLFVTSYTSSVLQNLEKYFPKSGCLFGSYYSKISEVKQPKFTNEVVYYLLVLI